MPLPIFAHALASLSTLVLPLAQEATTSGRPYTISWAVILLGVVLGLVCTFRMPKRETEVKKIRGGKS
ncbi:hypothetical protein Mal64_14870 [Pseudobythopirellula maris]|uniref:Uncharacterized protein n=1 Tax=Pseudobythopirellula maris TaxID=2527991 RepID=A0A5C5ZVK5_9BACT|nr:hypothetical protein [Pseudobythopirellula maris]TWT91088.1 hypothetical protein Mal64_14870 [Pseudobythopirellula maris]